MSKTQKINPMMCNVGTFIQKYGHSESFKMKPVEHEICQYYQKNCYSYEQIQQTIRGMKTSHSRTHNKLGLRIYKCKKCRCWHMTHEKEFKERKALPYVA